MSKSSRRAFATFGIFAVIVLVSSPQPASGQGLFQSIFGFLGPNKSQPQAVTRPRRHRPEYNPYSVPRTRSAPSGGGRFRTVCVRMCDGYYFPISPAVPRHKFHRDAQTCRARCAGDARLFYMPSSTSKIEQAYDQTGMAYKRIENAFLYRKKLINGCACRPAPWSEAERLRHRMYAINDDRNAARVAAAGTDAPEPKLQSAPAIAAPAVAKAEPRHALIAPAPTIATPRIQMEPRLAVPRQQVRLRPKPVKQPSWGLGAVFGGGGGSGLPPVKYRHKWAPKD